MQLKMTEHIRIYLRRIKTFSFYFFLGCARKCWTTHQRLFNCFTIASRSPFRNEHNCIINKNHNFGEKRSKVVAAIPLLTRVCRRKNIFYYLNGYV